MKTAERAAGPTLALWGGIECTINRVGDRYFDQLERSGHYGRPDDLDRIAALGIRTLRYPLLWERHCAAQQDASTLPFIDWKWADGQMARLVTLGIRPIVGLVHHGSGPKFTRLTDPCYAEGLARFAGAIAQRYPWVADYAPVNEPLTTARFSGLYGHWYPHGHEDRQFCAGMLQQCRAVVLSMRAVRTVNSQARLVQTDDLGKTFSTPELKYQADFENERRWLTWDLLCGKVNRTHPMWGYLLWAGASESALGWFLDNPCPPDKIGVNHYVTSERFLDHRVDRYPKELWGGNARRRYVDVEAVRVREEGTIGVGALLREAWDRYRRPLAVTEAHLGCTREDQIRWLHEVWLEAESQRDAGVDVRAVTAWALFGSYDWDSLLTRSEGHYEPGAYDLRAPEPRMTAVGRYLTTLAAGAASSPVLGGRGWWRRPERMQHGFEHIEVPVSDGKGRPAARPILIAGADSQTGRAFSKACDERGLRWMPFPVHEQICSCVETARLEMKRYRPWAVIDATDPLPLSRFPHDKDGPSRRNVCAALALAETCALTDTRLIMLSSDSVFDGSKSTPYIESDPVQPRGAAGNSEVRAEQIVRSTLPSALIVRHGICIGPWEDHAFSPSAIREAIAGGRPLWEHAKRRSLTYLPDLVHCCLDLLTDGEQGIWHLANGAISWTSFIHEIQRRCELDLPGDDTYSTQESPVGNSIGADIVLESEKGTLMRPLDDILECVFARPFGRVREESAELSVR